MLLWQKDWAIKNDLVCVNVYADEVQSRICPWSWDEWHYMWIVIEDVSNPLLDVIKRERFKNNFYIASPYYEKNNKIVHRADLTSADTKNIAKRRLSFIIDPTKSKEKFYSYIFGINVSKLDIDEFNKESEFNSIYNRFFRSSILYILKTCFNWKNIVIENLFHEEWQQQDDKFFPWHIINKIHWKEKNISFKCKKIEFLPKDHRKDERSNIIQLCDLILWISTTILHWPENSQRFNKYKKELVEIYYQLFKRILKNPGNKNSRYWYYNRIMVWFFPLKKTKINTFERWLKHFFTDRIMVYESQRTEINWYKQVNLF